MRIPHRLAYVLERDQELDGAVKLSITQFEPWIKHSNLPFFPEYTKHDIEHIEAVLRTAAALIRDEAWSAITPGDAAVLILGVLLHDCAMHLVEDGFLSLLTPSRSEKTVPGMSDKPWNVLWEEFYGEASRFDGRMLMRVFGNADPVRRPPLDARQMTLRDRLLIGEFLRRHHPRLAQEIALFGVPTKGSDPLMFEGFSDSNDYIPALSGLIARSHGENVRAFLPYLNKHFDVRQYKGVHPVFLMTVLRVADYVQVEADRAPSKVLQIKELASPVSQGEWKAHHAIKDVRHTHEDPEALFIDALPEDVQTFFRVQSWRDGIQYELDASWAVLGEVYGRYEGLNKLGLVLRRIRSSLDNLEEFSRKLPYLPVKAAFRGSDADLLKLLIEPLYGEHPEIGLRELIQNAVDAVHELQHYRRELSGIPEVLQLVQDGDVVVAFDQISSEDACITISDKGIGMTPEVVVDYFLTAGASFRRSEDWRKIFETGEGKAKVLRAGRFGIGALASFLLGPEIVVSTRHVSRSEGLEFVATVDSQSIELRRLLRPVGTTIKIRIPASLAIELTTERDWDWYCLSSPSVICTSNGQKLGQAYRLPGCREQLPAEWRRIPHRDYDDIQWTYSDVPELVCNGIEVRPVTADVYSLSEESDWVVRFGLRLPSVSVFDSNSLFPVNLQRTGLAQQYYPFEDILAEDVIRDFLGFCLVFGPTNTLVDELFEQRSHATHPELIQYERSGRRRERNIWYFTSKGFGYSDASLLHQLGSNSLLVARLTPPTAKISRFIEGPSIVLQPGYGRRESYHWLEKMINYGISLLPESADVDEDSDWSVGGEDVLGLMKRTGVRFMIANSFWKRTIKTRRLDGKIQSVLTNEGASHGWLQYRVGDCPQANFDFDKFTRAKHPEGDEVIFEVYLDQSYQPKSSPIGSQWLQVIRCPEIPYDRGLRQEKLQHAYIDLASYIKAYEEMRTRQS